MRKLSSRELFGFAFRIVGLVLAGIGAAIAIGTIVFVNRSRVATGEVIGYDVVQNAITFLQSDDNTGMLYYPRVAFVANSGERVEFRSRAGRPRRVRETGERVQIYYQSDDPRNARIAEFMNTWGAAVIVGGLGVLFLTVALLVPFGFGGSRR